MTHSIREAWKAFRRDTRGVSTVEYALIVVAVIAIVGGGATMLSGSFGTLFTSLNKDMVDGATQVGNVNPATTGGGGNQGGGNQGGAAT